MRRRAGLLSASLSPFLARSKNSCIGFLFFFIFFGFDQKHLEQRAAPHPKLELRLPFSRGDDAPSSLEEEVSFSPMLLSYDRSNKGPTLQLRPFPFRGVI